MDYLMDAAVFTLVTAGTFLGCRAVEERYQRLLTEKRFAPPRETATAAPRKKVPSKLTEVAVSLGRLAAPRKTGERSKISGRLSRAGYRQNGAVLLFYGIKLGLGLGLCALFLLGALFSGNLNATTPVMLFIPLGVGYWAPETVLNRNITLRRELIFKELPDTLDLLVICLNAGLGFDAALMRVSGELRHIAPTLSMEFGHYFFEIKSGLERETALSNLSERNGSEPLSSVVNVLLQSTRIGSDLAQVLKAHTDTMRRERQQTAEEQGAKLSTKLTLPLVLFILPALVLIVLGPAILNFISLVKEGL